jgi:hypothetical protein
VAVGIVSNPCPADISFTTTNGCLVATWEVTMPTSPTMAVAPICTAATTNWTVPAGGSVEQTGSFLTVNDIGAHQLSVYFNAASIPGSPASASFVVQ